MDFKVTTYFELSVKNTLRLPQCILSGAVFKEGLEDLFTPTCTSPGTIKSLSMRVCYNSVKGPALISYRPPSEI